MHPFQQKLLSWELGAWVNASLTSDPRFPSRPHHTLCLNGAKLTALVDTGSDVSIVREDILPQLGHCTPSKQTPLPYLWDIQGTPITYTGFYDIHFTDKSGLDVTFPVYAVPTSASEVLLGNDFLAFTRAMIDGFDRTVTFRCPRGNATSISAAVGSPMETSRTFTVSPVEDTTIEANDTQKVTLSVEVDDSIQLRPGATVVLLDTHSGHISVMDSLLTVGEHNRISVPITNNRFDATTLPRGTPLSSAQVYLSDDLKLSSESRVAAISNSRPKPKTPTPLTEKKRLYLMAHLDLTDVPERYHTDYINFVLGNHDVFSSSQFDLGHAKAVPTRIKMKTKDPVFKAQYKIPDNHRDIIDIYVKNLLRCNAIRRCRSPYNSPIFCVEKKDGRGGLRVVQDLRGVNRASFDDKFCTLDVRETVAELGHAATPSDVFSTLDLTGAFWQCTLHPADRPHTAFTIPHKGTQYEWLRSPMGAKQSSASMSRLMAIVFQGLEGVISYVDDILVHSTGHPAHLRLLRAVASRLRQHNLKLNLTKTLFGKRDTEWLGFHISKDGVSPSKDKVRALTNMAEPQTREDIESFLGLANFFRVFLPNLASLSHPLCVLTRKKNDAGWNGGPLPPDAQRAFNEIIRLLSSEPILAHPQPALPYSLYVDACCGNDTRPPGLGAVLCQRDSVGNERPVGYFSRQFRHHELNYSAHAAECRAILDAMDFFHEYVHGKKTTVYCDHRPAEGTARAHTKTLTRLHELLNEYDVDIIWRPGSENTAADALSRNAVAAISSDGGLQREVRARQAEDPLCIALVKFLADGRTLPEDTKFAALVASLANMCMLREGVLWFTKCRPKAHTRMCLFAPKVMIKNIISANHGPAISGHWGLQRTLERIMVDFYWPTMAKDTAEFLAQCPECQQIRDPTGAGQRVPLQPWPPAERPNQRVHADLVGPMKASNPDSPDIYRRHVLVITDAYSRWVELSVLQDKSAKTVGLGIFRSWICRYGCPALVVVDGGKEFATSCLKHILTSMHGNRHVISPIHPQANGQAERFNRSLKAYLTAMDDTTLEWEDYIPTLQWAHNSSFNKSTNFSPFYLTFLQDPQFPWSTLSPFSRDPVVETMLRNLIESRDMVRANTESAREAYTAYYNRKAQDKSFVPGDKVLVHYPNPPPTANKKLYRPWRSGYQVVKMNPERPTIVTVRHIPDNKQQDVHLNRVRLFHEFDDSDFYRLPTQPTQTPSPANSQPETDNILHEIVHENLSIADQAPLLPLQAEERARQPLPRPRIEVTPANSPASTNSSTPANPDTLSPRNLSFESASSGIANQRASTPILEAPIHHGEPQNVSGSSSGSSRQDSARTHNASGGLPSASWTSAANIPPIEELAARFLPAMVTRNMGIAPLRFDPETHESAPNPDHPNNQNQP